MARRDSGTLALTPQGIPHTVLFFVFALFLGGRFTPSQLSPGLPDWDWRILAFAAIIALYLPWQLMASERRIASTGLGPLPVLLPIFALWMALSSTWSPPGARVLAGVGNLGIMVVAVVAGVAAAARLPRSQVRSLWAWSLGAGILYLGAGLLSPVTAQGRFAAFGGGPNVFARVLAIGAVGAIAIAYTRGRSRTLWLVPPLIIGILLSGSRGGVLALGLASLVLAVPLYRLAPARFRIRLILSLTLGAAAAAVFAPRSVLDLIRRRFIEQTLVERYDAGRDQITERALELFRSEPIFGIGLDGYSVLGVHDHAHNLFISALTEAGLIGLALLLVVFLAFCIDLYLHRPLDADVYFHLLAALFILISSLFSGDYYDSRFLWLFAGIASVEARRPASPLGRHGGGPAHASSAAVPSTNPPAEP